MEENSTVVIDDIECEDEVLDLAFHPLRDAIAIARIEGSIEIHTYSEGGNAKAAVFKYHNTSVRCVTFTKDGNFLVSASSDCNIKVANPSGTVVWESEANQHKEGINAIKLLNNDRTLISGDDDGHIKVWDIRGSVRPTMQFKHHDDFIADMTVSDDGNTLLVASGDGTLSATNFQRGTLIKKSDEQEDELLSLAIMKHGRKVVVGTQEGILNIFSWNHWGDISDRFPGHPNSIDAIFKIDEDVLCTGSCDGIIRIVNILPNKLLGIVGEHEDWPIERIRGSRDKRLLGTCSHDNLVKFWDISYLVDDANEAGDDDKGEEEGGADEDEDMEDEDEVIEEKVTKSSKKGKKDGKVTVKSASTSAFFSDL